MNQQQQEEVAFFLSFGSGNMPLREEDIQRYH